MVGIVVVSHSRALARAAVTLAAEMVRDRPVRIEGAAGLDETMLGTDATAIADAITETDSGTAWSSSWILAAPYSPPNSRSNSSTTTPATGSFSARPRWWRDWSRPRSPRRAGEAGRRSRSRPWPVFLENKPIFVRSPKAPAWPERPEPAVPLLAALGVRELSVAPPAIPAVKEAVRATSLDRATGLAARALDLPGAAGVPALLAGSSPDVD